MTTWHDVALLRLAAQGLAGPGAAAPVAAVRSLLALQGQDLPGAAVSVALRTAGGTREAVTAALDAGELVRSWPLRGTLHVVAATDLARVLAVTSERMVATGARRRAELGLDDVVLGRARDAAEAALAGSGPLTRRELFAAWDGAGVATDGQRGYHLLAHLAQTGALCLGPVRKGEQLVVLTCEWVQEGDGIDRDEALGELTRRYLAGHGPATTKDLARWADLRAVDVRTGLAVARPHLERREVDGVELWLDPRTAETLRQHRRRARGVHLLPGFDELLLGYADRSAVLAREHAARVVPGGNGVFRPTVVHEGRVVGTWRTPRAAGTDLDATPFTAFADGVEAAARRRHARLPR